MAIGIFLSPLIFITYKHLKFPLELSTHLGIQIGPHTWAYSSTLKKEGAVPPKFLVIPIRLHKLTSWKTIILIFFFSSYSPIAFLHFYVIFLGGGKEGGAVLGQVIQTSESWV